MKDPWNPTGENIRGWAFDPDSLCEQNWDLAIVGIGHDELLMDLAADHSCPKRVFFLRCLYLLIGDYVRSKGRADDPAHVEALLVGAETKGEPSVALWAARSRDLLAHPERFDYNQWCGGGLAVDEPA